MGFNFSFIQLSERTKLVRYIKPLPSVSTPPRKRYSLLWNSSIGNFKIASGQSSKPILWLMRCVIGHPVVSTLKIKGNVHKWALGLSSILLERQDFEIPPHPSPEVMDVKWYDLSTTVGLVVAVSLQRPVNLIVLQERKNSSKSVQPFSFNKAWL